MSAGHVKHRCKCCSNPERAKLDAPLPQRFASHGATVTLHLPVAVEVHSEGLDVVVEPQLAHGPEHVLGSDGLALLALATLVGLAGDEADVLGDALLDGLLCIVGDLGMRREDLAHDPYHVGNRHEPVLLPHGAFTVIRG